MTSSAMKTWSMVLGCLALTTAFAQQAPVPAPDKGSSTTLRVDVKLVNVFCTVTDEHGAPVAGLTKDDFAVSEDGNLEKVAVFDRESELPLSIVLAIDVSLSTKKDLPLELAAARRFVQSILRPRDALSLYQFSEIVDELVPFTSDLARVERGIERVHVGSATAMYDTIYLASESLSRRQGRKVLVIITDGGDTVSNVNYAAALRAAQESEAIIYSVIVVPIAASAGRDLGGEHALIQLAHDTGGRYYYASGQPELDQAFRQISDELRTQYLLAYYPSRRLSSSEFRRIQVEVKATGSGELRVRHRTGYYTSSSR